jgi:hypothetical protein
MKAIDRIYEQAWVLQNQLRILIQARVNELNNPKLSYATSLIINHAIDLDFNIHASLHRCSLPHEVTDEIAEMLEEYVEIVDLVQRTLKLRK